MKTIIAVFVLVSGTGCATSTLPRAYDTHNNALNASIETALDKQEVSDKLRVGHTKYNFNPYYLPGTSKQVVVIVAPYKP